MKHVTIYSTPTCGYCKLAKEFMNDKSVPFEEVNVAADPSQAQKLVEMTGQMGVPVIDVDGQIMVGYDRSTLAQLLGVDAA